jgi:DNA processing protein
MNEELLFWIWLNNVKGIGPVTAKMLLSIFRDPEDIYKAHRNEFEGIKGIGDSKVDSIMNSRDLETAKSILKACNRQGISILVYKDSLYPNVVKKMPKTPLVLYYRGEIVNDSIGVGIVGSRRCTEYGKRVAVEAAEYLSQNRIPVISGMAKGIDSYAHTACLNKQGYTLAFLGCGVDICYPEEHKELMKKIIENGAVISEYAPGVKPEARHFPERNRLISAWSEKLLIVEAAENSGALITAEISRKQNKEVFAVPNNIYSNESRGTNLLIQNGVKIYLASEQLFVEKTRNIKIETNNIMHHGIDALSAIEERIISIVKDKILTINELMEVMGESKNFLIEQIAVMELEGKIRSLAGGRITAVGSD